MVECLGNPKEPIMVVLSGKFDGKSFVVEQLPADLPADTPVRIVLPEKKRPAAFSNMAAKAVLGHLPPDFAEQHEHYTKGTPKR
jgi:hypothetical protein